MPEPEEKLDPEVLRRLISGILQMDDKILIALLGFLNSLFPEIFGKKE